MAYAGQRVERDHERLGRTVAGVGSAGAGRGSPSDALGGVSASVSSTVSK
jgi:hypothetical protein